MVWIIYLLLRYNNKPLSDWTFPLSFPAILAVLSTASRAAAVAAVGTCLSQYKWLHVLRRPRRLDDLDLIEEASRGTVGSLWFIFMRFPSLATLGAIFIITSLGYGTFIQQLVELTPRDVFIDNSTAVFGLTHFYNGGAQPDGNSPFGIRDITTDVEMQGAIYKGLFNLGTTPVFDCPSVCEWPGSYVSLGFTATCADVTNATLDAHGNATGVWNDNPWYIGFNDFGLEKVGWIDPNEMNLTTPGGVQLSGMYEKGNWRIAVSLGAIPLLNTTEGRGFVWYQTVDGESNQIVNITKPLMGTAIVRVAALRTNVPGYVISNPYTDMEIVECDIHLAAYRYTDAVASGGKLSFGRKETVPLQPGNVTLFFPTDDYNSPWYDAEFVQEGLPRLGVRTYDLAAIELLLTSDRFVGNIYDGSAHAPAPSGLGSAFRKGNLTTPIYAMVDSMTDQLRSNFSNPATVTGRIVDSVLFITVRWPWIALPLVGTVMSSVFFILVIGWIYRHREDVPPWKSKITPMLMHQLYFPKSESDDDSAARLVTDFGSVAGLEKYTKKIKAQLEPPSRGCGPDEYESDGQNGQDGSDEQTYAFVRARNNIDERKKRERVSGASEPPAWPDSSATTPQRRSSTNTK
ncbi:hypothetical protein VTJ04DRAFT_1694 [Mycothermus thermophilus]|uniref:uncharacterized protein n=1 Tax=Humicola insolens TaxID=85995 RepID=UPI0037444513